MALIFKLARLFIFERELLFIIPTFKEEFYLAKSLIFNNPLVFLIRLDLNIQKASKFNLNEKMEKPLDLSHFKN
jgi:hypothetical protein